MKTDPDKDSAYFYLTELSPKDKPWDIHKSQSLKLKDLYQGTVYDCYAGRIKDCSGYLGFKWLIDPKTGELQFKLRACKFCRCRHCCICQWRRSLMWVARFLKALPKITADYPKARYVFLTLTVKNCEIGELRETLDRMNRAWQRLVQRKQYAAIGFARSTEVTKAADGKAHPHFHALLMVKPSYFSHGYLSQADWTELWRSCLRVDYTPIVNVKAVQNRRKGSNGQKDLQEGSDPLQAISAAIVETFKYSIKPEDLIGKGTEADREWLLKLTHQLHKTRAVALGGVFKNYLSEAEPENLIGEDDDDDESAASDIYFGWRELVERYIKVELR